MARIAYLDCFSGISGDMMLGALIDAGVDAGALERELRLLGVEGWSLRAERVHRAGIAATLARVDLAEAPQPHRRLPDVLAIIEASSLPTVDRERASAVRTRANPRRCEWSHLCSASLAMPVAHLGHFAVISVVLASCVETADDSPIVTPDRIAGCSPATPR